VRLAVVIAAAMLFEGCSSLPPILQRWAGLEIATVTLIRDNAKVSESYAFSEDGRVEMEAKKGESLPGPIVAWRVRGEWLEIDTANDGTFQTRMRPLTLTNERIIAENPKGKKSVWRYTWLKVAIGMEEPKRAGLWIP
jgi:hypothetical protein